MPPRHHNKCPSLGNDGNRPEIEGKRRRPLHNHSDAPPRLRLLTAVYIVHILHLHVQIVWNVQCSSSSSVIRILFKEKIINSLVGKSSIRSYGNGTHEGHPHGAIGCHVHLANWEATLNIRPGISHHTSQLPWVHWVFWTSGSPHAWVSSFKWRPVHVTWANHETWGCLLSSLTDTLRYLLSQM